MGVRDAPMRPASGASDTRSPGPNSPFRIISRRRSAVRAIWELLSDVSCWPAVASLSFTRLISACRTAHRMLHTDPDVNVRILFQHADYMNRHADFCLTALQSVVYCLQSL